MPKTRWSERLRRTPRAAPVLGALFCLCAQAHSAPAACRADAQDNTPPYTLWVEPTVQVNDTLGSGWMLLAPMHWTCSHAGASPSSVRPHVWVDASGITSSTLVYHDGARYRRFAVQQGDTRVGYIARWRSTVAGHDSDWHAVMSTDDSAVPVSATSAQSATYRASVEVQVRMVKIDATAPAANTSVHFAPLSAALSTAAISTATLSTAALSTATLTTPHPHDAAHSDPQAVQSPALAVYFKHVHQACTTPDVHVRLPAVVLTPDLLHVWGAGPAQTFDVRLENCPASLHGIDYRFQSIPQQDIDKGVLPLMATSSAAGVGIQVLGEDGRALAFDTWHALTPYDPSAAFASYRVALAARVIRTPGTLRAGSVHAAMQLTLEYK